VALNTYAGMLALQLAFSTALPNGSTTNVQSQPNIGLLRESKAHFERVKLLKPHDQNALAYIAIFESVNSDGKLEAYNILERLAGRENDETVGRGDKGGTQTELGEDKDDSEVEKQMHVE